MRLNKRKETEESRFCTKCGAPIVDGWDVFIDMKITFDPMTGERRRLERTYRACSAYREHCQKTGEYSLSFEGHDYERIGPRRWFYPDNGDRRPLTKNDEWAHSG